MLGIDLQTRWETACVLQYKCRLPPPAPPPSFCCPFAASFSVCFYHPIAGRHFEVWLPVFLWFPLKLKKLLQEIPFPFFTTALPYYQDVSGSSGQRHQKQLTLDRVCGCVSVGASRPIKSVKQAAAGGVCLSFVSAVLSPACANSYLRPECDGGGGSREKKGGGKWENWTQRIERGVGGVMNADEKSILPLLTTVTHPHHQHQCKKKGIWEFAFAALQCKQLSFGVEIELVRGLRNLRELSAQGCWVKNTPDVSVHVPLMLSTLQATFLNLTICALSSSSSSCSIFYTDLEILYSPHTSNPLLAVAPQFTYTPMSPSSQEDLPGGLLHIQWRVINFICR